MRTETRKITFKTYEELTEEQKKETLEKLNRDESFLSVFFETSRFCYDDCINELFREYENKKFLYANREKLSWNSSSQGWYFDRGGTECLTAYGEEQYGIYEMSFDEVELYHVKNEDELIKYADFTKNGRYISIEEVLNKKAIEHFKKECRKILELKEKFFDRLCEIIHYYYDYYPSDEEIIEYITENKTEFEVENRIVA